MADDSKIDMKQMFTNLTSGAASGQLIIEDGVANKCIMICQEFLVDLVQFQYRCSGLTHVDAFGSLNSAKALGQSFSDLGDGGSGKVSGSLKEAIQARIDAIQELEKMLTTARDKFIASDEAAKDKIRQAMKNING
ncbi:hypothetical protein [Nocardia macrotermitis]|nr:hypothetical protein [Nocardia macrotermitis]